MSCRHRTEVLRIPASALGFRTLREWNAFVDRHEEDFQWEEECFCESLSESYPLIFPWGRELNKDPDRPLGLRDPGHPEIVPGPFLDYYLRDIYPLQPEDCRYGSENRVSLLTAAEKKKYLPLYQSLFPRFTLADMEAVRRCGYEYYDGGDAPYLYSDGWEEEEC